MKVIILRTPRFEQSAPEARTMLGEHRIYARWTGGAR